MTDQTLPLGLPAPRDQEAWRAADRRVLWHPFTQMRGWMSEDFPVIVAAEGCELIDADGARLLDGISSLWVNLHGHRVPAIDEALRAQLDRIGHGTLLGQGGDLSIALAERLVALAPGALSRVFYSDDGSTAVEVALKMAFQYWRQIEGADTQRTRFLCLQDAYHGDTLGAVSVGGIELFHEIFHPLLVRTTALRTPRGASAAARAADAPACLERLDALLAREGETFCALVMEPGVQGAAGIRVYPDGFTRAVVERCRAAGLLVVLDEVATGFGRGGELFACTREGVEPDLLCLAKGLSGGYLPIAATLATEVVHDAFLAEYHELRTFFHGHSYTGNALACAASLASLVLCTRDDYLPRARAIGEALGHGLAARLDGHPHVQEVRRYGTMVGIEFVRARGETPAPFPLARRVGHAVTVEARRRGVVIRPLGDTVVLMPPMAISDAQIERLLDATCEAIDVVTRRVAGGAAREAETGA